MAQNFDKDKFIEDYGREPNPFENPNDEGYNPNPKLGDRYYPYHSKAEHDRAVDDTLQIFTGLLTGAGAAAGTTAAAGLSVKLLTKFKRVTKLIAGASAGVAGAAEAVTDFFSAILDEFKNAVSDKLEVARNWSTLDELKESVTDKVFNNLQKGINKKIAGNPNYDWMPQLRLTSQEPDVLAADMGNWSAKVANRAISRKMHKVVQPFSTFYPPDNIATDLDTFMTDEINTASGMNLSSVLDKDVLKTELKDEVQRLFGEAIADIIAKHKAKLVNEMANLEIYGASRKTKLVVINAIIDEVADMILNKRVVGNNFVGKAYIKKHYRNIQLREAQRRYREKNVEKRQWVNRETGLPSSQSNNDIIEEPTGGG